MVVRKGLKVTIGAVLFVAVMWGVLAAPGFLANQASTETVLQVEEARR